MFDFTESSLLTLFSEYAYRPGHVYAFIIMFMFASSFGLPIPEELVLVTAGLVAYIAQDAVNFPPPYPGALGVDVTYLMIVCFFAVLLSDLLVFFIGKYFGVRLMKTSFFRKRLDGKVLLRVNEWFKKYGGLACGIFRFLPGLRFAGHLSCGLLAIPSSKFLLIDGLAILISVPTQVYFVATYGGVVLDKFKEFKLFVLFVISFIILLFITKKIWKHIFQS